MLAFDIGNQLLTLSPFESNSKSPFVANSLKIINEKYMEFTFNEDSSIKRNIKGVPKFSRKYSVLDRISSTRLLEFDFPENFTGKNVSPAFFQNLYNMPLLIANTSSPRYIGPSLHADMIVSYKGPAIYTYIEIDRENNKNSSLELETYSKKRDNQSTIFQGVSLHGVYDLKVTKPNQNINKRRVLALPLGIEYELGQHWTLMTYCCEGKDLGWKSAETNITIQNSDAGPYLEVQLESNRIYYLKESAQGNQKPQNSVAFFTDDKSTQVTD